MNGFGKCVDGYVDVRDQLSRYVLDRAASHFAAERAEKQAIDSQSEFENRREWVRETFLSNIGGLPERMDNPSVETVERLDRDGYSVESVVFESRPSFHVTANCYIPDGEGPHPAVLFCCGHIDTPKTDSLNQKACIELASNGFVVLIFDPIAQGEREQYHDPETGETIVSGGGGVFAHCYAGQKCFYAGTNLARYMIHDARCGLDYLHQRTDTDSDRIGVTGTSGGGIQTLYLSLLDDRVAAAAPCCAVTERREWLKTGKRIDAEQALYGTISQGINYDDFLSAMAPRPVCIGAAASDEYFPIEGVREAFERTRRRYDLYDAEENVEMVVADTTHCSVYELGDDVFEWLCQRLGNGPYEPQDDHSLLDRERLQCTQQGSVRGAYDDERTIDDLIRAYVSRAHPDATTLPAADGDERDAQQLRETLVEKFSLDRDGCELAPRSVDHSEWNGLDVERIWFKTERDPDIVVTGVLVSDPDQTAESPAIVLFEAGTEALPERAGEVESLATQYGSVFVFDPRGVGAVRNRPIEIPAWVEDEHGIYGTEFKFAYDALQLETSLLGMRVYDVLRAVAFLRGETDAGTVSLVGEGIGAYHALYTAAVAKNIGSVELRNLGPSFVEMVTESDVPFHSQLTVFDVVGVCDVPHVVAALDERGVPVETA